MRKRIIPDLRKPPLDLVKKEPHRISKITIRK